MSIIKQIKELKNEINILREHIEFLENKEESSLNKPSLSRQKLKSQLKNFNVPYNVRPLYGIYMGVCMDTRDPWKIGRIMFYCPIIHNISDGPLSEDQLGWATPCSFFGSLDETGAVFIPPEGSVILLMFEGGNRNNAYYVGTTWIPTRADEQDKNAIVSKIEQYRWGTSRSDDIKEGSPNHLFPPWNNESYYGEDYKLSSEGISNEGTENINKDGGEFITSYGWRSQDMPHIYGIKTPEKHAIIFDDGSYDRQDDSSKLLWGKRVVLQSSKGNFLILKDDGEKTAKEIYTENPYFDTYNDKFSVPGDDNDWFTKSQINKHVIELDQTGLQFQSFGGGRLIIDDKIKGNLLSEQNVWTQHFPPDVDGELMLHSIIRLESITEHRITLSDHNDGPNYKRSDKDGIFIDTATGHCIHMIDDTTEEELAGEKRQILIQSTSGHKIEMKDEGAEIASLLSRINARYTDADDFDRDEDPYNSNDNLIVSNTGKGFSEKVCMKFSSGFGQFLLFEDGDIQSSPTRQYVQLSNAPIGEYNFIRMNQVEEDKLFLIRCAGKFIISHVNGIKQISSDGEFEFFDGDKQSIANNGNIVERALQKHIVRNCQEGDHVIKCDQGKQFTYALNGTMHYSYLSPHVLLGGVNPKSEEEPEGNEKLDDPPGRVLLYDPNGSVLPCRAAKWLIAN